LELYRETRKFSPRLITIFMTAYSADELIQQGMAEGVKTILDKPLDMNFLVRLLSAHGRIIEEAGRLAAE
jgi:CheY-like chemotaxis protein